ncbi:Hsp20/alpha crystallin family protein [Halosolutus gelatinilyticus]|uniref:Hsp20/alpha crystallin family protein n=1 Tax=Halosolutus gelatinilyticus TaxID=2931975 RepID=UPI001FF193E2|nr:Hsp20/alpha crystallin family protein [Halosolutus gelatinilyticus]
MRSFDEMNHMFSEMDRTFDQLRSAWWKEMAMPRIDPGRPALEGDRTIGDATAVTLEDEGDAYVFVMDLPGFETEDIDLTLDDGVLSVYAHHDAEEGSDAYRTVRSRRVEKRVPIPKEIVVDEIAASYHNGVLDVRLPIVEDEREESGHRIDID